MLFRDGLLFTHHAVFRAPAILQISSFWRPGRILQSTWPRIPIWRKPADTARAGGRIAQLRDEGAGYRRGWPRVAVPSLG